MKRLAIIADDYTGSNDTGVQFAKKGLKTLVVSQLDALSELDEQVDVIVVNTDSRADAPEVAQKKVAQVTTGLRQLGMDYIYKKLDSTLRGNIGAELAAAMEAGGYELAIVASALPSNGRTTVWGEQLVHGVPVSQTEIAKDPVAPVTYSYIPQIIQQQTEKMVDVIDLQHVLRGSQHLAQLIREEAQKGISVLVIDGVTQEDLDRIAESISLLEMECLLVGSAGLAESLPGPLGLLERETQQAKAGSVVAIAGSVSDVTRGQVEYAKANWPVQVVDVDLSRVLGHAEASQEELDRVVTQVQGWIGEECDVIIRSAETRELVEEARRLGVEEGLNHREVSAGIAQFLGQVARGVYFTQGLQGMLLTGGDIAVQCASAIGARATLIQDEVLPGIPVGILVGDDLPRIPVVTKAGAFGEEGTFIRIFEYLRGVGVR